MELLKIDNGEGFLCLDGESKLVSQVTAEDISKALELILTDDGIEITEEPNISTINNPAHKIIFEQLLASLKEVFNSRDAINDEINETFAKAEETYLSVS